MSNNIHSSSRSLSAPMLFSVLPPETRERLLAHSAARQFAQDQLIQQKGDVPQGFWLIEEGSVAIGQFLRDGDFRGVAMLGPGDSWGELAMFAERPRVVDAVARSACILRHISTSHLETALREDPAAMRALLGALSLQLQEVLDVVAGIRRGSAPARIAAMVLTLAERSADPGSIAISQHELGELLGLTRVTVNGALKHYEKLGLLKRRYGKITLLDSDGLRQASLA